MKSVLAFLFLTAVKGFVAPPSFGVQTTKYAPTTPLHVTIDTSDIKNGITIELNGEPHKVINFSVMKQARGAAKTTIKFKNLMKGNTIENTYRSGEKFQTALVERKAAQFTYTDGDSFYFMDSETFEECFVQKSIAEDKEKWISDGMEVTLVWFNEQVIDVNLPNAMVYEIVETDPNVKGNSAQGHTKPATLDCGAVITVPGYLATGEKIKVDPEKGEFLSRV
eukprot:CAMPEP_0194033948 /NCGR_PEP_ID=MMETSP0009_2-20130614/6414_1 /TAXON_ID=210454 /ORGANISM="Grammatophora oceanica, Strain CCMP 410" /LENGTH=222 /DNA_ID=CAMNT_0038674681 /DNA_START=77 /DNA_END=745 /DNA_ORIENTATION=+